MSHHIVAFRAVIWSARFSNTDWRPAGRPAFQFRHPQPMNYGVVALLAIAPYLLIVAGAFFLT